MASRRPSQRQSINAERTHAEDIYPQLRLIGKHVDPLEGMRVRLVDSNMAPTAEPTGTIIWVGFEGDRVCVEHDGQNPLNHYYSCGKDGKFQLIFEDSEPSSRVVHRRSLAEVAPRSDCGGDSEGTTENRNRIYSRKSPAVSDHGLEAGKIAEPNEPTPRRRTSKGYVEAAGVGSMSPTASADAAPAVRHSSPKDSAAELLSKAVNSRRKSRRSSNDDQDPTEKLKNADDEGVVTRSREVARSKSRRSSVREPTPPKLREAAERAIVEAETAHRVVYKEARKSRKSRSSVRSDVSSHVGTNLESLRCVGEVENETEPSPIAEVMSRNSVSYKDAREMYRKSVHRERDAELFLNTVAKGSESPAPSSKENKSKRRDGEWRKEIGKELNDIQEELKDAATVIELIRGKFDKDLISLQEELLSRMEEAENRIMKRVMHELESRFKVETRDMADAFANILSAAGKIPASTIKDVEQRESQTRGAIESKHESKVALSQETFAESAEHKVEGQRPSGKGRGTDVPEAIKIRNQSALRKVQSRNVAQERKAETHGSRFLQGSAAMHHCDDEVKRWKMEDETLDRGSSTEQTGSSDLDFSSGSEKNERQLRTAMTSHSKESRPKPVTSGNRESDVLSPQFGWDRPFSHPHAQDDQALGEIPHPIDASANRSPSIPTSGGMLPAGQAANVASAPAKKAAPRRRGNAAGASGVRSSQAGGRRSTEAYRDDNRSSIATANFERGGGRGVRRRSPGLLSPGTLRAPMEDDFEITV